MFRCDSDQCRVVIGYAGDSKNFFTTGSIAAAFGAEPDTLAPELRKIGQRLARWIEKPENLMVDTAKRHQVGHQGAIRDSALHECDLNSGIRIVQKS